MKRVRKKEGKVIQAYCLGESNAMLDKLMENGLVRKADETHWRILSREADEGEAARSGDYIKVDSSGAPYPNSREYFLKNHKPLGGDNYEQIPQPLNAWWREEGMCPEIQFLIDCKGLVINENNEEAYYSAPLWGDLLSAAKDAVIVFYSLEYDSEQKIADADFNFVARDEFDKTYDVIGSDQDI